MPQDELSGRAQFVALYDTGLAPTRYDQITLTYTGNGDIETVTYKEDGATVAVLTLTYSGVGVLTSVTRSG